MRYALALALVSSVAFADQGVYKIVCDPTATAKFSTWAKCTYVELAQWKYIQAIENPCDETAVGRELRDLLGGACRPENKLGLSASDLNYTRVESCHLPRNPAAASCEVKYESQ